MQCQLENTGQKYLEIIFFNAWLENTKIVSYLVSTRWVGCGGGGLFYIPYPHPRIFRSPPVSSDQNIVNLKFETKCDLRYLFRF